MGSLMKNIVTSESKRKNKFNTFLRYVHLPTMQLTSKGSTESLLGSSFCKHFNSFTNATLTNENSYLSPRLINMLVNLCTSKNFVKFMWKHYETELQEKLVEKNSRHLEALINQNDNDRELIAHENTYLKCY